MFRRIISTLALAGCAAVYATASVAVPERATFILTTGERKSGPVVFHGSDSENLINGFLNLGVDNGPDLTFPIEQVAVIDFVGGHPSNGELDAVGAGHALALRNGTVEQGHFVNLIGGQIVRWRDQNGNTRDIPISQVSRIYLNPSSAYVAFGYTRPPAAAVATPAPEPGTVRVLANQPWTSTRVSVRRGDLVTFRTTGQIIFGQSEGQVAGSDGNDKVWNRAFPVTSMPVGGLIGKVANSAPFAIGSNTQPIQMPANGMLMLGVNDNEYGDNGGFFSVVVTKR